MKSRPARNSFLVPHFVGSSETYMTAHIDDSPKVPEQLDLFRKTLTRRGKVQVLAMLALSDPKHLDSPQEAKVADIARTMGYEPYKRPDGKEAFQSWVYESIEDTGMHLRWNSFDVYIWEYDRDIKDGRTRDGKRKQMKGRMVNLSILQEFGFYYEDEDGQPINLEEIPEDQLIKVETPSGGNPLYAIPMTDENGNFIRNKDGKIRRQMANGVTWAWASRFAKLGQKKETSWVFYLEALNILRRYLSKDASFDLMFLTLFWKADRIEMSHKTLVSHLNIRSKDSKQVQAAIDAAFADALKEGIIDKPVTIRPAGYYRPTKSGKSRRKDMVYQWKPAQKWRVGPVIDLLPEDLKRGKTEVWKDGIPPSEGL